MKSRRNEPDIQIGIGPTSDIGVVVARYSGKFSRMWAWDARTLEVIDYQDIKAGIEVLDVSPSGRYCAYRGLKLKKGDTYVAICRPPYFRALWIRNALHTCPSLFLFETESDVKCSFGAGTVSYGWPIAEVEVENSPLQILELSLDAIRQHIDTTIARTADVAWAAQKEPYNWSSSTFFLDSWTALDCCGRTIGVCDNHVVADGVPFIDCTRTPFRENPPPDWAGEW